MNSFQLSARSLTRRIDYGLMLIIIGVIGIVQYLGLMPTVMTIAHKRISSLLTWQVKVVSEIGRLGPMIRQRQLLAHRVQDLELHVARLSVQLAELEQLKNENEQLRTVLNSSSHSLQNSLITQPILSYAQPTIALDPDQKVTPGTAVLVEGVLVGTIAKQQLGTATVNLLWQKETLPILAETDSKVQGLVMGDGIRVLFTEVPVDQELTIGQQVVSVGQTGVEQGLFIGEIRAIVTGYSNAVKTAVLEQYVSFYQVGLVEVRF